MEQLDAVVIGGGQAGLGMGRVLQEGGRSFVILERGRIGETWRSQRWDTFAVNTPNWSNGLPGLPYDGDQPDGFWLRDELVDYFERYAGHFDLPVRTGVTVTNVEPDGDGGYRVETTGSDGSVENLGARNVVVASGLMQRPRIPAVAGEAPGWLEQLHTGDYRKAGDLADGAVVVVGSGQSGCQIADDLLREGRVVFLCTSKVARVLRRHRGRDVLDWLTEMGFWEVELDDLPDPAMQFAAQPQVSGVGRYGATLSYQHLAGLGARLLGRVTGFEGDVLRTDDSLADNIAFADERSAAFRADIEAHIAENGIDAPPPEPDPADEPAGPEVAAAGLTSLDLREAGVGTLIWCTGFGADFDWLRAPVFDGEGRPTHRRGVTDVEGIYFLGFPWLHTRKSGVIYGIDDDARHLGEAIAARG